MTAAVLDDLFEKGALAWGPGYLTRAQGSCQFCVNQHWQFPLGCPYGKPKEPVPPVGFLEKVAAEIVRTGREQK
jgi:hypothetical protein